MVEFCLLGAIIVSQQSNIGWKLRKWIRSLPRFSLLFVPFLHYQFLFNLPYFYIFLNHPHPSLLYCTFLPTYPYTIGNVTYLNSSLTECALFQPLYFSAIIPFFIFCLSNSTLVPIVTGYIDVSDRKCVMAGVDGFTMPSANQLDSFGPWV